MMLPYANLQNDIPVLLAPMSGVTDAPFRKQAIRFGAKVAITEMVAGEELTQGHKEAETRLTRPTALNGCHVVQLVGRTADPLRRAAHIASESGADVIDINMGCPSRRVTGGLSGSALMRDLDHAESLIAAVHEGAGKTPVTLKMRLGWGRENLCAPELTVRAQKIGVSLITIHGRTRQDFYNGEADWSAVRASTRAANVPVIVNGDIVDAATAREALARSEAKGVMIGRAATGLPWLIDKVSSDLNGRPFAEPDLETQIDSLLAQTADSIALYGNRVGIRVVRKHVSAAFDYWLQTGRLRSDAVSLKPVLCQAGSLEDLTSAFTNLRSQTLDMVA